MKNRQTLSAVLLTALIAGLAYLGISRGPVARQADRRLGWRLARRQQSEPRRLAKPVAVALPETAAADEPFPFRLKNTESSQSANSFAMRRRCCCETRFIDTALGSKLAGDPF